jgi:peptide/nickel transport system substrate-binding protein
MRVGIRRALALAAAGLMLAGCGQSATSGGGGGDSLVVGEVTGVQKIDPQVATKFVDFAVLGLIYEPLIKLDAQLRLTPDLATSWTFGDGGSSLTLKLRRGVKFHDGSTFTSADARASLQRVLDPPTGAAARSYIASVASIDTPDTSTLVLHLSRPDAAILSGLASTNLAMLPARAIQDGSIGTSPDGTGPFRFSAWDPQTSFSLTRNDRYWGGAPKLKKVQVRVVPNEQSMVSALRANTVQVGILSQPQVARQLDGSGIQLQKVLGLSYRALMLQSKGPLARPEARLAIQCAIDRGQVVKSAVMGDGKVVGPVPQGPYATDPNARPCPTRDVARAKSYLAQAGVPGGFTFDAMYAPEEDPTSEAQVVSVQSQLAQVGIQMKPDNQAGDAYVQRWLAGSFDAAFALNGAGTDPATMYDRYFGAGANLARAAGYSSPALAQLLREGDASTDRATRKAVYQQVFRHLEDNAVWIWLFDADQYTALTARVHGYQAVPTGSLESLATATLG